MPMRFSDLEGTRHETNLRRSPPLRSDDFLQFCLPSGVRGHSGQLRADSIWVNRGSISVYDLDAGHRLIRTIHTVPSVNDVRGVAGSAVTGKLYVAYHSAAGTGMVYCLDIYQDTVLWNTQARQRAEQLARTGR